jgi:hypothetical protein
MDTRIREMLDIYAADVDSTAKVFWYRGQRFSWSVLGDIHVCITRHGSQGRFYMTMWHNVTPDALVAKMNRYMQSVRWLN